MVAGKSLVRYWMITPFSKKDWMKLIIHNGKYMTQLLMSELALMMKTVRTTGMKCMKRIMYSRANFYIFARIQRSGDR